MNVKTRQMIGKCWERYDELTGTGLEEKKRENWFPKRGHKTMLLHAFQFFFVTFNMKSSLVS